MMSASTTTFIPTTYYDITTATTFTATTTNTTCLNTTSSSSNNLTNEEIHQYLECLQGQEFKLYIPAFVFLVLIAVTGLVGNVLVLLVYWSKYPMTPVRIFIMTMALFDLVNIVCVPGRAFILFHLWDYVWPTVCRLVRFTNAWTTISSTGFLVAVAVDRFRKICRAFGTQITVKQSKGISIVFAVLGCILSLPYCILSGIHTRATPLPGIVGHECFIEDRYAGTIWPLVMFCFFLALVLSSCVALIVLYSLIGVQAYRHRYFYGVSRPSSSMEAKRKRKSRQIDESSDKPRKGLFGFVKRNRSESTVSRSENSDRQNPMNKTTLMLFLITAVFIMSFLPHLVIVFFRFTQPNRSQAMGNTALAIENFLFLSYLINTAANPIIYSLCDAKFRKNVFRVVFMCWKQNKVWN